MKTCTSCGEQNSENARFCQACGTPLPATPEAGLELHKTISVISCEMAGDAEIQDLLKRADPEIARVLERHGGVRQPSSSDRLLATFGFPLSREDDSLRAVKSADEIKRVTKQLGDGIEARIAVTTGTVGAQSATDQGTVSGDAVDSAQELSRVAPVGEVVLGAATYRLVRDAVKVDPFAPAGSDTDLPAAYLLLEVTPGAVMGTLRNPGSDIVGRAGELRQLKQLYEETVAAKGCRVVTLFGPAGVGKSRLAAEFGAWGEQRAYVMEGQCLPYGEAITFWPIAEALKVFIGIDDAATEKEALNTVSSILPADENQALIAERVTAMMGLSDATPSTQETFWAIRKLLEVLARERPLIFLLDDIHWAEPTLLDLIEHIAGFSSGSAILVLCQSRNELVATRPTWATVSDSIPVDPLSDDHVRALIDHLLGDVHLPEPVSRRIRAAAEGNPLYVEEILRMFLDEGTLVQTDDGLEVAGGTGSVAIPPTIQALLAARLDRLEANERVVLQAASVIGKTFWGGAVADLVPEGLLPTLARCLQELGRKELLFPERSTFTGEDAYRFGHILMRDATYATLSPARTAEMHERFAAWLENKAGDHMREYEEILGYHLEQAYRLKDPGPGEHQELVERAWGVLGAAGRRAFARADMPAAAGLLNRAIDLLPEDDARLLELSDDLVDALRETGEFKQALALLDRGAAIAKAVGNEAAAGRASIQRCSLQIRTGDGDYATGARALATDLIPLFVSQDDELGQARAYQLLAELDWESYNFAATEHSLEQALAHARRAETAHDEAKIVAFLAAAAFWGPMPVHDAIQRCEDMLSRTSGNLVLEAKVQLFLAGLTAMDGDFSDARALLARSRATLGEFGLDLEVAASSQEAGLIELLAGDARAAEEEFRAGHDALEAMGEVGYLSTAAGLLARALYLQDNLEEAERYADLAADTAAGDQMYQPEWAPSKARILARKGQTDEALELGNETVRITTETDDVVLQGDALMALGEVMEMHGDRDEAREVFQRALALYEIKGVLPWVQRAVQALGG